MPDYTTIDYVDYASDSWLILPMENEVGKLTEIAQHLMDIRNCGLTETRRRKARIHGIKELRIDGNTE